MCDLVTHVFSRQVRYGSYEIRHRKDEPAITKLADESMLVKRTEPGHLPFLIFLNLWSRILWNYPGQS